MTNFLVETQKGDMPERRGEGAVETRRVDWCGDKPSKPRTANNY